MVTVARLTMLSAVLATIYAVHAVLAEEQAPDWLGSLDDDEAISFMQSRSVLKSGPYKLLSDAASELLDATSFSQANLEVMPPEAPQHEVAVEMVSKESAVVREEVSEAVPVFMKQEMDWGEHHNEDTCSLEGLSPGVCAIAALAQPAAAAVANEAAAGSSLDFLSPGRLEQALFKELEAAMAGTHGGFTGAHLQELESELSGLFAALPKNEHGRLDHATARYALHQHFLRQHAWYIRSLNPVGEAQTPASPGEALRGQVPAHLQRLLEKQQEGRGLGLAELAALVATLEHLIQGDVGERLKAAYAAHGLRANGTASGPEVANALETFMAHFLSLEHRSGYALTPKQAQEEREVVKGYSGWPAVVELVHEAVQKKLPESQGAPVPFADALAAAKEVMHAFEFRSAGDCREIKQELAAMPGGTVGGVFLADLHRKALEGAMLFAESTEYLATLGALDESEPGRPRVLVPNYVYSPSNCLGTTSFFDMCCPNECEALLERLEHRLHAPEVAPADVAELLTEVRGQDALSGLVLSELDSLAYAREGRVALHGLAFAQWLHRAFPHECPRPRAEDFTGARGAEVPDAERDFQPVAQLEFILASKAELLAELRQEEMAVLVPPPPVDNSSRAGATLADGSLQADKFEGLVAQRLAAATGLKLAKGLDATSLAQTQAKVAHVEAAEQLEQEDNIAATPKSGLNVKGLQ
mmetsp:Transcript_147283/g.410276  ORF Transcript_147283/g.410276 Transcript_147283/m.410276 type:complete len:702 (+) Transcript_147283:101-2206(+)